MESLIDVARVETTHTRDGNTRYVVRAGDGSEYTTFRPQIGEQAKEERNGFKPFKDRVEEDIAGSDG